GVDRRDVPGAAVECRHLAGGVDGLAVRGDLHVVSADVPEVERVEQHVAAGAYRVNVVRAAGRRADIRGPPAGRDEDLTEIGGDLKPGPHSVGRGADRHDFALARSGRAWVIGRHEQRFAV